MWIVIVPLGLALGVTVVLYLRSIPILVDSLEQRCPRLWDSMGKPRWERMQHGTTTMFTVTPLFPFLSWLLKGDAGRLDAETRCLYERTRRLLLYCSSGMLLLLVLLTAAL